MSDRGLKIRTRIMPSTDRDTVEGFVQYGIIAHLHPAVVYQDQVELPLLSRLPRQRERRVIEGWTQETGIRSHLLSRGASREQFEKWRHLPPRRNDFLHPRNRHVHRWQ